MKQIGIFLALLALHPITFFWFGTFGTAVLTLIFYAYFIDKCSVYFFPLSIIPMPIFMLPIIQIAGLGNWMALNAWYAAWRTMFLFVGITFVASLLMNRRKRERTEEGLTFYEGKRTPHLVMGLGTVVAALLAVLLTILEWMAMH